MPRRAFLVSFVTILCLALLVFGVHASYDDDEGNHGRTVTVFGPTPPVPTGITSLLGPRIWAAPSTISKPARISITTS